MGSQTLEILRQGVWASLTGGWFYDPHQGVFCNVVHLYLWMFLLCSPLVTYLYFPATMFTWAIHSFLTSLTILGVKITNMALHRLYDQAQTMSETNLKNPYFKVTPTSKNSDGRDHEVGIEMQVLGPDVRSQNSVEQAINEASDGNSMISMENANSILDLKADVHRKNSSESIELMFYAPSVQSSATQLDQQSITTRSNSISKSFRSTAAASISSVAPDNEKYLTFYPDHESEIPKANQYSRNSGHISYRPHLERKSSEDFKHWHHRRRLERQNSLDVAAESAMVLKLDRSQLETLSVVLDSYCIETFLHPQQTDSNPISASKVYNTTLSSTTTTLSSATATSSHQQRLSTNNGNATTTISDNVTTASIATNSPNIIHFTNTKKNSKTARLQRHRSSETHDERIKQQNRSLFLPIHHEHHHVSSDIGSSCALAGKHAVDELELGLGGSAEVSANSIDVGRRGYGLLSLVFGSSSDVYLEDDSFTKSDLDIEQLDKRKESDTSGPKSRSAIVLQQRQHKNLHYYQPQQQFRQHHHVTNIRKDSNSTMSALQLPTAAPPSSGKHTPKRRRHSNATSLYKNGASSGTGFAPALGTGQPTTVRRIKSAALEISCPHPSVSNLVPHPNSVEAINGQQQIKNPKSALLPPPSTYLVRNPHLNLCPIYDGSFESNASSLNFGGNSSTRALIDPVYPIVEQADEKTSMDLEIDGSRPDTSDDLVIHNGHVINENAEAVKEEFMHAILGDDGDDENVAIDIDTIKIAEHDQYRTSQALITSESDVCQIIDNDELKSFDDNLERNLNELHADELLKAVCTHGQNGGTVHSDSESSEGESTKHCIEATKTQEYHERLQSSDSETDKNSSCSPLLSSSKGRDSSASTATDKTLMSDIASGEQQKPALCNLFPQHMYEMRMPNNANGEEDSGFPSSDCEQVSAGFKNIRLSEVDAQNICSLPIDIAKPDDYNPKRIQVVKKYTTTVSISAGTGKSLGAIPKVVKYRELDETRHSKDPGQLSDVTTQQLRNRPGAGNVHNANDISYTSKTMSRPSSSTSSVNFSADSFSADIHKMLWLMSGGAVDDNGCPIMTGPAEDAQSIAVQGDIVPPNMSVAHFQFYQDALNTLHSHPCNSVDGSSIADRKYLREKIRRSSKQISEAGNSSLAEFPHTHNSAVAASNDGAMHERTSVNGQAIQAVIPAPTLSDITQTPSSDMPQTIEGLINVINDGSSQEVQERISAAGGDKNTSTAILNIDEQIENYFDYWRPACMLSTEKPAALKSFYKYQFKLLGLDREIKISMDRLELLALFDRDLHWIHILLSVILSATVSYLGATILQLGFYKDLFAFLFCAVIAGSQYSLVKSVQPDAASPIHGFNKTVAYSRAIYFSCCGGLLILFHGMKLHYERVPDAPLMVFGMHYSPLELTKLLLYIMYVMLLCFPLIFSLGLFPQINTFLMYFMEQLDMNLFGGNASSSLLCSFFCVTRSIIGVLILYGPLYISLAEGKGTQYIVFSIFCAMLIPLGYHLSRSASDLSHLWALIKNTIVSTYRDDDDELSAATSGVDWQSTRLSTNTPKRTNTDASLGVTNADDQIELSSLDKLPQTERELHTNQESKSCKISPLASSNQTITKTLGSGKKTVTASSSFTSVDENQSILSLTNGRITGTDGEEKDAEEKHTCTVLQSLQNDEDKLSTSSTTNPGDVSTLTAGGAVTGNAADNEAESPDPLPKKLQSTVNTRLKNDFIVTALLAVIVFGLHSSTVFSVLQPDLNVVLYAMAVALGLLLHYMIPQMRKHMPWLCFARPLLRQKEFGQFEVANAAKVMWFEKVYIYLCMLERNILFPLLVVSTLTADAQIIAHKFGIAWGSLIVATCALKFIRNAYSDPTNQYLIVMFTVLFFRVDFVVASESFLIDYFFVSIAYRKCSDFLLKFIVTYIAPWQITWGSAFHAFAQPFSVPHSAMLFLQAGVSALLSTPLNPFLGSAIFLTSYVRPIKFWERDYNTRRIDHSNTRLSSQLERDLGADDNNLNSIFYEHLTRSLQHSLCGDLVMGRWGNVNQGDCFVLASDYLNCLVHIIELGNGLCTFQIRGLEFRGTYCQQREVEAITEDVEDNDGCCCCDPGHLPRMLSANAMFSTRWLAWQVVAAQYILEGYSISDNLASATLQVFEYRKVLITYYIKSIIYYVVKNPKLEKWLSSGTIQDALEHTLSRQFVDLDPIFNYNLDEDFDFRALGITRTSFCFVYLGWIQYCWDKRRDHPSQLNVTHAIPSAMDNPSRSTQANQGSQVQVQSPSQTQIQPRPQKSATMSGTGTTSGANANSVIDSSEHIMGTSQSFINISRQNSESAPGLPGVGSSVGNGSTNIHVRVHDTASRVPQKMYERYYNLDSPAADSTTTHQKNCAQQPPIVKNSPIVSLCLALGLLARRSLATASHSSLTGIEFFLHGLHALFKGDFRITSPRDEWVFADMDLLHSIVAPAVKMALKLQQDHISNPDEFLDPEALYSAITTYSTDLVISHEADPIWRSAVLRGASNLLALRHVLEDGSDEYRIIRLTKRFLSFRVIKLNRECVRGLWAGQQQELIYLRNRNPERGSIQNAKQALRNIINSSCDQPIGYPIYVSPLTTSYADTNEQLCEVIGGPITPETIKSNVIDWWHRVRERCRQGCSSGSALDPPANLGSVNVASESGDIAPVYISAPLYNTLTVGNFFGLRTGNVAGISGSLSGQYVSQTLAGVATARNGLAVMNKPTSTTLLAGLLNRERDQERERDTVRDPRILRKSQTNMSSRCDRERRATLPNTSSCLDMSNGANSSHMETTTELMECEKGNPSADFPPDSSPRHAKISSSSGNLGIGNIITTPGEYPRKSKGSICLTAAAAMRMNITSESKRKAPIELFRKVIIIDGSEIYDCLDLGRRIDVIWPNEKMRANGGRLSWRDWTPRVGMVGYVVHHWLPNHADKRFRSHVNRALYLIEIGDHYVPVGEFGVREYYQVVGSRKNLDRNSNRSSVQLEYDERLERERQRDGLMPILGSSLESPAMPIMSNFTETFAKLTKEDEGVAAVTKSSTAKITAVSSSSSDDEELSNLERRMEMHRRDIINMMKLMSERKKDASPQKQTMKEQSMLQNTNEAEDVDSTRKETDYGNLMQTAGDDFMCSFPLAKCQKTSVCDGVVDRVYEEGQEEACSILNESEEI